MPWTGVLALVALVLVATACGGSPSASSDHHATGSRSARTTTSGPAAATASSGTTGTTTSTTDPATSTSAPAGTTAPTSSTTTPTPAPGPLTSPPLPAAGPGFVAEQATAVGDSVMLDYQTALQQDVPGIDVQAAVSRQWSTGVALLQQLQAAGQLGAVVVVGLGTNGPITTTDFNSMMSVLSGAARVVFVNVYVDREWQDPNNAVIAAGVGRYHNAVLADWYTLASQHPTWLYSTQTHLPINGPGAQALAALVAAKV